MQVARIAVIGIALGSGLIAAMIAVRLAAKPPVEVPVQVPVQVQVVEAPKIEQVEVLVLNRDIAIGTTLTADDMSWEAWPKSVETDAYIVRSNRANARYEIAGSVARTSMLAGEPLREQHLVKAERGFMSVILAPGMRAIAIEARAVGTAGGFVLPNDQVDVILTRTSQKLANPSGLSGASGDAFVSETIMTNVKVLAVDQQISERKGETSMIVHNTLTLEVTPHQAEQIAQAQQLGTISLTLRPLRDSKVQGADDANQVRTVKVVRFGQTTQTAAR